MVFFAFATAMPGSKAETVNPPLKKKEVKRLKKHSKYLFTSQPNPLTNSQTAGSGQCNRTSPENLVWAYSSSRGRGR